MKHSLALAKRSWLLLVVLFVQTTVAAAPKLFGGGKSDYQIVLAAGASESEQTAARELQAYLRQISGAELPVVEAAKAHLQHVIYIGFDSRVKAATGAAVPARDDESFTYETHYDNLYIYGGRQRGTMYGVFTFLERELGVRWYTADFTVVPKRSTYRLTDLHVHESPAIRYRFAQYFGTMDDAWCGHNKNNTLWGARHTAYGDIGAYWNAHTCGQFVHPEDYFESHPEYFALRDGKRIADGQLCLTNPDVLRICTEQMLKAISTYPDYWVYSMSQNDNKLYCQCEQCTALAERYQGQSGVMLWFVNQVAAAVKAVYPDKYIGTFAYQYTRKAPVGIAPADNVVIRLCSIECCFAHALDECEHNKAFMDDLRAWQKLAPRLYIWDYVVDFAQYHAPFPNLQVLARNIQIFREHNAIGIQEEAQYQSHGGEFAELKAWLLARLLWNPDQPVQPLIEEFVRAYYGAAADAVLKYIQMCRDLVTPQTVLGIFIRHNHELYNDDFTAAARRLLDDARKLVAGDSALVARLDRVRLQPMFLHVMRSPEAAAADGTRDEYLRLIRENRYRPREHRDVEAFIKELEER